MKTLKEEDVLRIMREEWESKVSLLTEKDIDVDVKVKIKKGQQKVVISDELKVKHKKSKIRYTVKSVGSKEVILLTPEKKPFTVPVKTLESEYELA